MINPTAMTPTPPLQRRLRAIAIACLIGSSTASVAAVQLVDRVSVLVNDAAITEAELGNAVQQLRGQNRAASDEQLRKLALEELIMLSLQEQEAARRGLSVDDATLDRAVQSLAEQNKLSLSNFRKQVVAQGLSWNELRDSVRRQILLERLREREVTRRISVSDQEIDDYLEQQARTEGQPQYQLEHFVVPLRADAKGAEKQRAEAAVAALRRALAEQRSAQQIVRAFGSNNIPLEGGPLGWRLAKDLPSPMDSIVPRLMTGEASEPVVDGQGVHVLRLLAVRQAQTDSVEQSRAAHILLKLNPLRDDQQAQQELEQLRAKALAGEDFSALAEQHSEDYASAVMGGDLGWFGEGAMVPEFEARLKLLAPGQISQVFETPFGWHLIKLEGRRQAKASQNERRRTARAAIADTKRAKTTQRWLQQLRDQAYLEYPDEP